MACTCTEDFEQIGNVRIGRNKVVCQECLDREALRKKEEELQEKKQAIVQLELANLRKLYDGEDLTAINIQREAIRADIVKATADVVTLTDALKPVAVKPVEIVEEKL